jgi:hypothetical protein
MRFEVGGVGFEVKRELTPEGSNVSDKNQTAADHR